MKNLYLSVMRFINDEEGVTSIEYAFIASLIAMLIISAVAAIGTIVCETFRDTTTMFGGVAAACPS